MVLKFRTRLAQLIAHQEGYGRSGAVPTRNNNPGDLRHGPGAHHALDTPNGIGTYATPELGEFDLEHQLTLFAKRGLTIRAMVAAYAPPTENDTDTYLDAVCQGIPCTPDSLVSEILDVPPTEG